MKKILSILLTVVMMFTALPIVSNAAETAQAEAGAQIDLADVACLNKDLPHGDAIWAQIASLESERLPENAQPEDYTALFDEVEAIVTASDEYVDGSLTYSGDTLYWDTPDGMAHGWSPTLRAEANGWSNTERAQTEETVSSAESDAYFISDNAFTKSELAGTGADTDLAEVSEGSTTAKNIALFSPYYGYSGDVWDDATVLLNNLASITGGTSTTYSNGNATIDALADALESCAVVIMYTHGSADRYGAMYDTRISNTSYLCLTTGTGITEDDTAWVTGSFGRYRHAFNGGKSSQADGRTIYFVDGTAIANHMEKQAPNNLLWMQSCLTMATNGLCKPLMDRGVGVVFGYSKPSSAYGGSLYTDYFFESLLTGATVSTAARYMKQQAGSDWDPIFKDFDYSTAVSTGIAFPVFAADNTPYPGQYSVDGTQTVGSTWRLPVKDESTYLNRSVVNVNILQRIDFQYRFDIDVEYSELLSGSLPPGMTFYWRTGGAPYVRGTPTATGAYSATYRLTCTDRTITQKIDIAVVKNQTTEKEYNYSFTSGNSFSKYVDPSNNYFSCKRISGNIPPTMNAAMTESGLHIETTSVTGSDGKTYVQYPMAGEYTVLYEIVTKGGERYLCTVNITVKPKETSNYYRKTITMAKGLKGIVSLADKRYFRVVVENGSLPDGVRPTYSYDRDFCILGTPTATGTYTVDLKLYTWNGYIYMMPLTVNVIEPNNTSCSVNLHDVYGKTYSTDTRIGNSAYTLPSYSETLPDGVRFTGWWYDNKVYQAGDKITVNAMTLDVYALCADNEPIKAVGVSGVVAPKAGATPTYSAQTPSGAFYQVRDYTDADYINGVSWHTESGKRMLSTDVFEVGKKYTVIVTLETKSSEYVFAASGLNGTINTNAATAFTDIPVDGAAKIAYVLYTFTCPQEAIKSIEVTIAEPYPGALPSYAAFTPDNAGYQISDVSSEEWKNGVLWRETASGKFLDPLTASFEAGKQYDVLIWVVRSDRNTFATYGLTGKVNLNNATVTYPRDVVSDTSCILVYTFSCKMIDRLEISEVTPPVAGAHPSFNASVPANAGYMIRDFTSGATVNGITWSTTSGRTPTYLNQDSVFEEGKTYTFRAWISRKSDDLPLAPSGMKAKVNGRDATISYGREGVSEVSCYVSYTFTCEASSGILGDVDNDGTIMIIDATLIGRHLASIPTFAYNESVADTDLDGVITIMDATYIQRWLVNLKTNNKIGKKII